MKKVNPIVLKKVVELINKRTAYRAIQAECDVSPNTISKLKKLLSTGEITSMMDAEDIFSVVYKDTNIRTRPSVELCQQAADIGLPATSAWNIYQNEPCEDQKSSLKYSRFADIYRSYKNSSNTSNPYPSGVYMFFTWIKNKFSFIDPATGKTDQLSFLIVYFPYSGTYYIYATNKRDINTLIVGLNFIYNKIGGYARYLVPISLGSMFRSSDVANHDMLKDMATYYKQEIIWEAPSHFKEHMKARLDIITSELDHCFSAFKYIYDNYKVMKHFYCNNIFTSHEKIFAPCEKPYLLSMPSEQYPIILKTYVDVGFDFHVHVLGYFYSVPYQYAKCKVRVETSHNFIAIYLIDNNKCIATHDRLQPLTKEEYMSANQTEKLLDPKYSTYPEHMPTPDVLKKGNYYSDSKILNLAHIYGSYAEQLTSYVLDQYQIHQQAYRKLLGILSIGKKEPQYFNLACKCALENHVRINHYEIMNIIDYLKKQ